MSLIRNHIYEFGNYRIDPTEQTITRNTVLVPLTPKVFETLLILLENPGRLVEKDEFMARLWPGTFVDEVALSQNISRLRKALGDGNAGTTIIQTVPKRGYRLVAEVRISDPARAECVSSVDKGIGKSAAGPANRPIAGELPKPGVKQRFIFVFGALLALVITSLSFQRVSQPTEPKLMRTTQITSAGKADTRLGLQLDGSRVIFGERRGPNWQLRQTSVGGGPETSFETPFPNARIFGLSPDQTTFLIATAGDSSGGMPLWIMPVQGGSPLRVGVSVDAANWFPDGKRILCSQGGDVFSVERDGSNRHHLFNVAGTAVDLHWHPNGAGFDLRSWIAKTSFPSGRPTPREITRMFWIPGLVVATLTVAVRGRRTEGTMSSAL